MSLSFLLSKCVLYSIMECEVYYIGMQPKDQRIEVDDTEMLCLPNPYCFTLT